jgi:hypothetical protein
MERYSRKSLLGIVVSLLGLAGLLLCLAGPTFPAAARDSRILQVWPDRSIGVASGLLEDATAHATTRVLPFGVCSTSSGDIVRARTYLRFPLDVFPPGTEILRTTLYVYMDSGSDAGEAAFGAYRVLESWEEDGWDDDPSTWPKLLGVPIAATVTRFDVVTPPPPPPTPVPTTAPTAATTPTLTATETSALFSKPAGHGLVQGTTTVTVTLYPLNSEVAVGATTTVDIRIENVIDLYSADVYLTFDEKLLEVVDADPDTDGVQIEPGNFLGLDAMVEDQDSGEIYFFQEADDPVTGSGVLASIIFQGKNIGTSSLDFEEVYLDDGGQDDAYTEDGSVTVTGEESSTPTPSPSPTFTSTSTPGPSPTPTLTSTPGPSPTPTPTPTSPTSPLVTPTPGPTSTPTPRPSTSTPGPTPTSTSPLPTPTSLPSTAPVVPLQQGAGTWLAWDVTALMRAWQAREIHNYGLALAPAPDPDADPETTGDLLVVRWLAADDHETRPYLIVEFEVHPVTPEPVLPPAGSPAGWGVVGLLLIGVVLLFLGLAVQRGSQCT